MAPRYKTPTIPFLIYRLLLCLLAPAIAFISWRKGRQWQDSHYFGQRMGRLAAAQNPKPLWFHAASVGEVNAIAPLVKLLLKQSPELPILFTTNTPTGGQAARNKLPETVQQVYLPVDWRRTTHRFLQHYQPRAALIMETELWPNLYQGCAQKRIPLLIVNGRVSDKTLQAPAWLRSLYRYCLQQCQDIYCRSQRDQEGFIQLGADKKQCRVLGNIKFSAAGRTDIQPQQLGRPYVLAASTREGEEALIVKAWQDSGRRELLVIAPRHIERINNILADLQHFNLNMVIRSKHEPLYEHTDVYIADTFGELPGFMAGSELVIMGGSFVAKGGHNILEAAALGKAVITGPHMENFAEEAVTLLQARALYQCSDSSQLTVALQALLQDDAQRQQLADRAQALMAEQGLVLQHYAEALQAWLAAGAQSPVQ